MARYSRTRSRALLRRAKVARRRMRMRSMEPVRRTRFEAAMAQLRVWHQRTAGRFPTWAGRLAAAAAGQALANAKRTATAVCRGLSGLGVGYRRLVTGTYSLLGRVGRIPPAIKTVTDFSAHRISRSRWLTAPRISTTALAMLVVLAASSVLQQTVPRHPVATHREMDAAFTSNSAGMERHRRNENSVERRHEFGGKLVSAAAAKVPVRDSADLPLVVTDTDPSEIIDQGHASGLPVPEEEDLAAAMPSLVVPDVIDTEPGRFATDSLLLPVAPKLKPSADLPQWLANAVESRTRDGRPLIAIVIDDVGIDQTRTARAVDLPAPLTLAFIPYGYNLESHTALARERGHELLVHIPMEPSIADVDPGPNALLTDLPSDEIMRRLRWGLSRFDGYVGVSNHMGSLFMANSELVRPMMLEMRDRGLLFLDSRTRADTVGTGLAQGLGVPNAKRDVFLDNERSVEKISMRLDQLEAIARKKGYAVGLGHPHDVTLEVLAQWIPEARERGLQLVPISAIVRLAYSGSPDALLASAGGGETNGLLGGTQ